MSRYATLLLMVCFTAKAQAATIDLSPRCDFDRVSLVLLDHDAADPNQIALDVELAPAARKRMFEITRDSIQGNLKVTINGLQVADVRVINAIETPSIRFSLGREVSEKVVSIFLSSPAVHKCSTEKTSGLL